MSASRILQIASPLPPCSSNSIFPLLRWPLHSTFIAVNTFLASLSLVKGKGHPHSLGLGVAPWPLFLYPHHTAVGEGGTVCPLSMCSVPWS